MVGNNKFISIYKKKHILNTLKWIKVYITIFFGNDQRIGSYKCTKSTNKRKNSLDQSSKFNFLIVYAVSKKIYNTSSKQLVIVNVYPYVTKDIHLRVQKLIYIERDSK